MEYELMIEALADLPEERYALFDIRDEITVNTVLEQLGEKILGR